MASHMFSIDDASIRAVHTAYERGGELLAVVELRERFPGVTSNAAAADCVRRILAMQVGQEALIAARMAEHRRLLRKNGYTIRWT